MRRRVRELTFGARCSIVWSAGALLAGCTLLPNDDIGVVSAAAYEDNSQCAPNTDEGMDAVELGFVCSHRFDVDGPDASVLSLPYCGDEIPIPDPVTGAPPPSALGYRWLVISQHGRGSDGQAYYEHLREAADASGVLNETFIIAPQFLEQEQVCEKGLYLHPDYADLLRWEGPGLQADWPLGGLSEGTPEDPVFGVSSYAVLEQLISTALKRLPNVTRVVFAGQSAGGQLTQRFAALNMVEAAFPGIHFRYVPANPQAHMFMGPERPVWSSETQSFDFEVPDCGSADQYHTGLQGRAGWDYVSNLSDAQIQAQYSRRDVVYLAGEADIEPPDPSPGCRYDAQGPNRRERARGMHAHIREFYPFADHGFQVVPDVAHGGGILEQECARRHLFSQYWLCNQDEYSDASGGASLPSSSYATDIAFGNVDDDPAEEVGIAFDQESGVRVVILDDADHDYAVLFEDGASWGNGTRATTIAFGDVDGDGRDEIAYGRESNGGPRYWIVDDALAGFAALVNNGGSDWGDDYYPTDLAFGNADGDGREELAIARRASSGNRVFVLDDALAGFAQIFAHGNGWGGNAYATGVAFGNVDHTDTDPDPADELAFTRVGPAQSPRVFVFDDAGAGFAWLYSGGEWGSGRNGTAIAMGDFDNDGRDEIAVARSAGGDDARVFIMNDAVGGYATLASIGQGWGNNYDATSIAIGDRIRSSTRRDTLAVGRSDGGTDARIFVYEVNGAWTDAEGGTWKSPFVVETHRSFGADWGADALTRAVAFGDTDGHGRDELGWAREHDMNARWGIVHDL